MTWHFPFMAIVPVGPSPISGLIKHYDLIRSGVELVKQAWLSYIEGNDDAFADFRCQVDEVEEAADKVKRGIRNHMPKSLFMPVDKTVFFNYTRSQDDILDSGQDCLNWIALRKLTIKPEVCADIKIYIDNVLATVTLLRVALVDTVEMVNGGTSDREEIKQMCRDVGLKHKIVNQQQREIVTSLYASDREFKETYQILKAVEELHNMSHSAERCGDMLRAMIAK